MPLIGKRQPGCVLDYEWMSPGEVVQVDNWDHANEILKIGAQFYLVEDEELQRVIAPAVTTKAPMMPPAEPRRRGRPPKPRPDPEDAPAPEVPASDVAGEENPG